MRSEPVRPCIGTVDGRLAAGIAAALAPLAAVAMHQQVAIDSNLVQKFI
jgi:hypothetical protein